MRDTIITSIKEELQTGTLKRVSLIGSILLMMTAAVIGILGQNSDPKDPARGGVSGSSFAISDIENINLTNGNLNLNLPLVSLPPTRGGQTASIGLTYNSKVYRRQIETALDQSNQMVDQNFLGTLDQTGGWKLTNSLDFEFLLTNRFQTNAIDCSDGAVYAKNAYRWKVQVQFPDGNQRVFVPVGGSDAYDDGYYDVSPNNLTLTYANNSGTCSSSSSQLTADMVYRTIDGTFIRMVVTHDSDGDNTNNPYTLYFPDGSVFQSSNRRLTDSNGNYIQPTSFTYGGQPANGITDQLGRKIFTTPGTGSDVNVIRLGVDGAEVKWVIRYTDQWVRKPYRTTGAGSLRAKGGTSDQEFLSNFDLVVDEVQMPSQYGNLKYEFGYDGASSDPGIGNETPGWGQLNYIKLPSGAEVDYEYDIDSPVNTDRVIGISVGKKSLTYLAEYDGGSTSVTDEWDYSILTTGSTVTGPDGSVTVQTHGNTLYEDVLSGFVKELIYPNGTKIEKVWGFEGSGATGKNPYVKFELTSLKNSSGSYEVTSTKEFAQDRNGNITSVKEYGYVPYANISRSGGNLTNPPSGYGSPVRSTYNTYYYATPDISDTSTSSSNNYWAIGGVKRLKKSTEMQNSSNQGSSRQEFYYDGGGYTSSPSDGNLTETRTWDSTKGSLPSADGDGKKLSTAIYISNLADYDTYGNVTETTDPEGNTIEYTYGTVSGPSGTVSGVYPTQIVTAANDNGVKRTSSSIYDFYTGVVTTSTDEDNDLTTLTEYDGLGRPLKVRSAYLDALESWTQTSYDDSNRRVIVKSDIDSIGDGKNVSIQHFDQIGRVRLERTLENPESESPTNEQHGIKVQKRYKFSSGYSYQLTSNPYRAANSSGAGSETTMGWTLATNWANGRRAQTETFEGQTLPVVFGGANTNSTGIVRTDIDADRTMVTDQASKRRVSKSDSFGRLIDVWEIRSSDGDTSSLTEPGALATTIYGYHTSYEYNVLDSLTQISKTPQTRTYNYSSLSRLTSSSNPESGSISYVYDNNGNLVKKTDARGVDANYSYDNLDRLTQKSYATPSPTPDPSQYQNTPTVTYSYGTSSPKVGKLTQVASSISTVDYTAFDNLGRVTKSTQTTAGVTYGNGSTDSYMSYKYNLAGDLIEQQYPSGRVVKNLLGVDGDLAVVKSKKNASAGLWNYADSILYSANGEITSMQLGNGRWNSTTINSRLQYTQIALGTVPSGTDKLDIDYSYGSSANNGNVESQVINFSGLTYPLTQAYTYDSINRLASARETSNGTQTWKQTFVPDRFGNRRFDFSSGNTTVPSSGCTEAICNPTISTSTNKISSSGWTYDAAGNTVADANGQTYVYDAENLQVKVSNSGGILGEYFYDGNGKRVKKIVPGSGETTIFVYDEPGKQIAEYSTIVADPSTARVSYIANDPLGSPRVNLDANGAVTARHDYYPYGEEISTAQRSTYGADLVRRKFTSFERDDEIGLEFAQSRYYSAAHGRFTSPDEFKGGPDELYDFGDDASDNPTFYADLANPQSLNKYQYTYNNPYKFNDPTGHCPLCGIMFSRLLTPRLPIAPETIIRPVSQIGQIGKTIGEISRPVAETVDLLAPVRPIPIFSGVRAEAGGRVQTQQRPQVLQAKPAKERRTADKARTEAQKQSKKVTNAKDYPRGGRAIKDAEEAGNQAESIRNSQKKNPKGIESTKKSDDREIIKIMEEQKIIKP